MKLRLLLPVVLLLIGAALWATQTEWFEPPPAPSENVKVELLSPPPERGRPAELTRLKGELPQKAFTLTTLGLDLEVTRDGTQLITGDARFNETTSRAQVWDMTTGKVRLSIAFPEWLIRVAISPDDTLFATVTTGRTSPLRIWRIATGELVREIASPLEPLDVVRTKMHYEHGNVAQLPNDQVWNRYLPANGFGFTSVGFTPDGSEIAVACDDGVILFWDVRSGRQTRRFNSGLKRISDLVFSSDKLRMLTGNHGGLVQLWDLQIGKAIQQFNYPPMMTWYLDLRPALAFSSDGSRLAYYAIGNREVRICDSYSGELLARLPESEEVPKFPNFHSIPVIHVAFVDQNTVFLCGSYKHGGTKSTCDLRVWDLTNGKLLKQERMKSTWTSNLAQLDYARYLPDLKSVVTLQHENDSDTDHADWCFASYRPLASFPDVDEPVVSKAVAKKLEPPKVWNERTKRLE